MLKWIDDVGVFDVWQVIVEGFFCMQVGGNVFVDVRESTCIFCKSYADVLDAVADVYSRDGVYVFFLRLSDKLDDTCCAVDVGERQMCDASLLCFVEQFIRRHSAIAE